MFDNHGVSGGASTQVNGLFGASPELMPLTRLHLAFLLFAERSSQFSFIELNNTTRVQGTTQDCNMGLPFKYCF